MSGEKCHGRQDHNNICGRLLVHNDAHRDLFAKGGGKSFSIY